MENILNEKLINISFSKEQIELLLTGLSELPLKVSGALFYSLRHEATRQLALESDGGGDEANLE